MRYAHSSVYSKALKPYLPKLTSKRLVETLVAGHAAIRFSLPDNINKNTPTHQFNRGKQREI